MKDNVFCGLSAGVGHLARTLTLGARVVTDISGAMQGFIGGGGNHLIQLHEESTGVLGAQGVPGALEYCLVSTDVRCDGKTDLSRYGSAKL